MKNFIFNLSLIIIALVSFHGVSYALDSCVVPDGQTYTIDEHSECREVENATGQSIMVPTKTANEWSTGGSSFIDNTPAGVTLGACSAGGGGGSYCTPEHIGLGWSSYAGSKSALSGNYAILGHPEGDHGANLSGAAYVYDVTTGALVNQLLPNDPGQANYFGGATAIDGNIALVGAYRDDSGRGSAYVFDVTTGTQLRKLLAPSRASGDYFGQQVALDGNIGLITAYGDVSGAAHVFNVSTGTHLHKLTPSAAYNGFGTSVDIDGNIGIVGARYDNPNGASSGAAYIFDMTTGAQLHKLVPSDNAAGDQFGISVAIKGNYAVVGAPYNSHTATAGGAAYVFDVTTGAQLYKLIPSNVQDNQLWGGTVEINDNIILVSNLLYVSKKDQYAPGSVFTPFAFDVSTGAELGQSWAYTTRGAGGRTTLALDGNASLLHTNYYSNGAACIQPVPTCSGLTEIASIAVASLDDPEDIVVSGNYAYVSDNDDDSLDIFDISNPAAPVWLSAFTSASLNGAAGIELVGNIIYVNAPYANTLTLVDISNPISPSILSTVAHSSIGSGSLAINNWHVTVDGGYAYVVTSDQVTATGTRGVLTVFNVSNPASPFYVTHLYTEFIQLSDLGVRKEGNLLYMFLDNFRAAVFDVSTPTNPVYLSTNSQLELPVYPNTNTNYYANDEFVLDVTDPNNPKPIFSTNREYGASATLGNYVYAANNTHFTVLQIDTSCQPGIGGGLPASCSPAP